MPNIYLDETLDKLGRYLKDGLNGRLPPELKATGALAVNAVVVADFPNTPTIDYPVLKLYRLTDSSKRNVSGLEQSYIAVTYSLLYPQLSRLPGLLRWVSSQMKQVLAEWQFEQESFPYDFRIAMMPDRCEYSLAYNSMTQEMYPFLRWTLIVEE